MKQIFTLLISFIVFSSCAQTKEEPVRGTWITNVASVALRSEKNIKEAVTLCKQKGLNNIYVVVWNGGVTMYPSKVVESYIGIKQHPIYNGFDPIKSIIEEGHKQGIKVHAAFSLVFRMPIKTPPKYGVRNIRIGWAATVKESC